jgi:hypothetical protein
MLHCVLTVGSRGEPAYKAPAWAKKTTQPFYFEVGVPCARPGAVVWFEKEPSIVPCINLQCGWVTGRPIPFACLGLLLLACAVAGTRTFIPLSHLSALRPEVLYANVLICVSGAEEWPNRAEDSAGQARSVRFSERGMLSSLLSRRSLTLPRSYLMGRVEGCDIIAEHESISRFHLMLQFGENGALDGCHGDQRDFDSAGKAHA